MDKVYGAILSPFVRKVLLVLEYKQRPYELETVIPWRTPQWYRHLNPLKKIPSFKDEYIEIGDSSVIADYLEHKYPQPALYPQSPPERAKALWLEEFVDTRLQELLGLGIWYERILAPRLGGRPTDEQKVKSAMNALPEYLDHLERTLCAHEFLLGATPTIADIAISSVFLNARYADYHVDCHYWPKLAAYLDRIYRQDFYQQRLRDDREMLERLLAKP